MRWQTINAITKILEDAISGEYHQCKNSQSRDCAASGLQAGGDVGDKITEDITPYSVGQDVKAGTRNIKLQKLGYPHLHAAGERRRHGVYAGDEFDKEQGGAAMLVKTFCRTQNASFRI